MGLHIPDCVWIVRARKTTQGNRASLEGGSRKKEGLSGKWCDPLPGGGFPAPSLKNKTPKM